MVLQSPVALLDPGLPNLALSATATASSSGIFRQTGIQTNASNVNDNTTTPWVSVGGGPTEWIALQFPKKIRINTIYLYDEGDINNQIASGELKFSDGSLVTVIGGLNNDGSATIVQFSTVSGILSVNFTITGVSATTSNAGLSEMQVYFDESLEEVPGTAPLSGSPLTASKSTHATDTVDLTTTITKPFESDILTSSMPSPTSPGVTTPTTQTLTPAKSPVMPSAIAGAVIGGIFLLLLLVLLLFYLWRRRHTKKGRNVRSQQSHSLSTLTETRERPTSAAFSTTTSETMDQLDFFDPQALFDLTARDPRRLSTIPSSHYYLGDETSRRGSFQSGPSTVAASPRMSLQSFRTDSMSTTLSMSPNSSALAFTDRLHMMGIGGRRRLSTEGRHELENPFMPPPSATSATEHFINPSSQATITYPSTSTSASVSQSLNTGSRQTSLAPPTLPTEAIEMPTSSPSPSPLGSIRRKPVPTVDDDVDETSTSLLHGS